jgi:branched-chain amino acid transport system ATP-binding protein
VLSVTNLNVWYGKSHVVRDLSIEASDRQIVGILGRNGVGKTTTMRAIMGIVARREGRIAFQGKSIESLASHRIARAGLGYVPQGRQLFPRLTVRENLQLAWHGNTFTDAEMERGIAHFPPLRKLVYRHAGELSGGEQQMVAIGRALLNAPRAVLFDEPTEGLAPLFIDKVREVITMLHQQGITVVLVEQNLRIALSVCQYVYFMEKGTVAHACSVEQARSRAVLERFLGVHVDADTSASIM